MKRASMKDVDLGFNKLIAERRTRQKKTREANRRERERAARVASGEEFEPYYLSEPEEYFVPDHAGKTYSYCGEELSWDQLQVKLASGASPKATPRPASQTHLSDRILRSHEGEDYEVVYTDGDVEHRRFDDGTIALFKVPEPDPVTTLKLTIPMVSESGAPLRDVTVPVPITIPDDEWLDGRVATVTTAAHYEGVRYPLKFDLSLDSDGYRPEIEHRVEPLRVLPKVHREKSVMRDEEGLIDTAIEKEY